jgi:hypothetical protein
METLLIIALGIALVIVWNSSRDAIARMRDVVDRLEREMDFLRSQVAGLVRTSSGRAEEAKTSTVPASSASTPAVQPTVPRAEPTQTAHVVPAPVAPFTPASQPKPVAQAPSAVSFGEPVPVVPHPATAEQPVAKPAAPSPAPEPKPAAPPPTSPQPTPGPKPATRPVSPPPVQPAHAMPTMEPARGRLFSLEETLGANWLNKIGIAILVIGLAFFLAYKLQTWGPGGKILCGFAVSVVLLGGGVWLERKPTYRIFARGGIGGGWALAYFTTFAAYHLQAARVLDTLPVDLALMLFVAAGMVGHSLLYRSQTVTSLAFMLGFATLLTSHVEEPTQTVVFSLAASAILAVALVVVTLSFLNSGPPRRSFSFTGLSSALRMYFERRSTSQKKTSPAFQPSSIPGEFSACSSSSPRIPNGLSGRCSFSAHSKWVLRGGRSRSAARLSLYSRQLRSS